MMLQVPGGTYDIVGRGGAVAPSFSPAQLAELLVAGAAGPTTGSGDNRYNVLALGKHRGLG